MKINKSLDIDLNIISPQKHIRIHEGDVDSVDILIGVSVDDETVDLDGVTIKYDATINNYLAEQDADGSVVDGKISIPVTQNMTAMSGLLLIDVRMIQSDQILFTQTICATVEKAVVNGSTYIDFDKVTIIQRMNVLEEKMEHVEEIVENFDTSKLIVSTNRPPSGAPSEVDVDLLRVGDTWILSGANIVYKLVEAQYNYQPVPDIDPYHKFTWKPMNERYGVGNTEPPTSVTYQEVVYTINEEQWSWLPVPEYFEGDQYKMLIGVDDQTYYICKSASMSSTGICTYVWREEGGAGDLSTKMDLAPLNPTSEQIAAMPSGQFYSDTVNHKGYINGLEGNAQQIFLDEKYITNYYVPIRSGTGTPPSTVSINDRYAFYYNTNDHTLFYAYDIEYNTPTTVILRWKRVNNRTVVSVDPAPDRTSNNVQYKFDVGDLWIQYDSSTNRFVNLSICIEKRATYIDYRTYYWSYTWVNIYQNSYTKTEIDAMIPTVPTNISAFTNDSGYLTLDTLPIYDGTVI